jgi:hypothetical protein
MLKEQLMEVGKRLAKEQQARDKVVDQGRRAFRLGIEQRNCPLSSDLAKLWNAGWENEKKAFDAVWSRPRREGSPM